jgi:hypothetical protein
MLAKTNTLTYFATVSVNLTPGAEPIEKILGTYNYSFCKLDRFKIVHYFHTSMKRSSLQKSEYINPKFLFRVGSRLWPHLQILD